MIRIERDPAWWSTIAAHPAVAGAIHGLTPAAIGELATRPGMIPMAAEHGGFLFAAMDGFGFIAELHTLFTPEGWGREAMEAGREALQLLFSGPCQAVATYEVEANRRSRPPVSFGFTRAGEFRETAFGSLRLWILTRGAWEASPAHERYKRSLS
ncbi:MAG: hypothetical protein ACYC8V_06720 [Caulobacteraceae bacterium]